MRSVIDVYNTALARLGGNQFDRENTPGGDGTEATLCRTLFPHVLELSLAHTEWSFATTSAHLARRAASGPPSGLPHPARPYRYALPGDCVRPVRVRDEHGREAAYVIEGQDLLTGVSPAVAVYVRRVSDPSAWPPAFADAVAWALAAELSTALVNDPRRQQYYAERAREALGYASAVERNSERPRRRASPWVLSRQSW